MTPELQARYAEFIRGYEECYPDSAILQLVKDLRACAEAPPPDDLALQKEAFAACLHTTKTPNDPRPDVFDWHCIDCKRILAALRRVRAEALAPSPDPPAQAWQPIETAPKDVLVVLHSPLGRWVSSWNDGSGWLNLNHGYPTHWLDARLLPPPSLGRGLAPSTKLARELIQRANLIDAECESYERTGKDKIENANIPALRTIERLIRKAATALDFEQTRSDGLYADVERKNTQLSEQAVKIEQLEIQLAEALAPSPDPEGERRPPQTTLVESEWQDALRWRDKFLNEDNEQLPPLDAQVVAYLIADAEELRRVAALPRSPARLTEKESHDDR